MPRFRFTLRAMMIVVAVAGVVACALEFKNRRSVFLDRVAYHAKCETNYFLLDEVERSKEAAAAKFSETVKEMKELNAKIQGSSRWSASKDRYPLPLSDAERFPAPAQTIDDAWRDVRPFVSRSTSYHDRLAWHAAMRAKYERAARYPWLPVTPDPPEPK